MTDLRFASALELSRRIAKKEMSPLEVMEQTLARIERLKIAFSPDLGYAKVQKDVAVLAERAALAFEETGHSVTVWKGASPDAGDLWIPLVCTDIYAQQKRAQGIRTESLPYDRLFCR